MEGRILGIDLTDQGAGVMFSDSEQCFHVPAAICRDKKHDLWYVGEEAYEKALSGKGILTDRLMGLTLKSGTATMRGVRYEGAELLCRYLGMVRDGCFRAAGGETPALTVLVLPKYDRNLIGKLMDGLAEYGFDREKTCCITRQESFLYFVMNQPREVRTAEVGLFDLSDQSLDFYELQMKRDRRNLFVRVDEQEQKDAFSLSVLQSPSGEKLADKIMSSAAERLLKRKVFSAVFLTGKGFENYDWAEHFMKFICQRRKVFLDEALFVKGAVIRGASLLSGKGDPGFTALCSGRAAAGVTLKLTRGGQQIDFPVLNAGDPVYTAGMKLKLLPLEGEVLEFSIDPVSSRKKRLVRVLLPGAGTAEGRTGAAAGLKDQPGTAAAAGTKLQLGDAAVAGTKTQPGEAAPAETKAQRDAATEAKSQPGAAAGKKPSYVNVSIRFPDEETMHVQLSDAGFGDIFPPDGARAETEVSFTAQEPGLQDRKPCRALLCSSVNPEGALKADVPGIRIYSAEELCYCILEHPLLFMDGFAGGPMLRFLEEGAGERLLAAELRQLKEARVREDDLLLKLPELLGYAKGQELSELRSKILSFRQLTEPEYMKEKADEMFRLRRFGRAVMMYDRILSGDEEKALPVRLKGRILTSKGSACANLFLFEKAFRAYSEAWRLLHEENILKRIWFLSLTEPVIGAREKYQAAVTRFAAEDPALVTTGSASASAGADPGAATVSAGAETSLPLEEWEREFEEARHRAEAGPGKQEIAEIFESDPVQRMKKAAAQVKQWKQDYRTML